MQKPIDILCENKNRYAILFPADISDGASRHKEKEASPDPSAVFGGDDTVPYSDGVKIRLFTYDHELDFPSVSTKWGNFHMLPANHEHQLRKYRHAKMGLRVLQTPASVYFIRKVLKQQLVQPAPGVLLLQGGCQEL